MSLVADALQPFLVKGLINQKRPSGMTLADLIGRQEKIGFDLDFDNINKSIYCDFRDARDIVGSIASDVSRFASASFQTIRSIQNDFTEKETVPWAVVRTYYAAFYAGQALTRLFGESCSYFDREHIARIWKLGKICDKTPEFTLSKSVYRCVLNDAATAIDCKSLREGAGGAHETFWNVFGLQINRISEDILSGSLSSTEAQAVFSKMNSLRQCIRSRGAPLHSWLSVVRNEVQYRHTHDVWFPCAIGRRERQQLGRLVNQWTRDPMDIDVGLVTAGSLGEFAVACAFIVALCRTLLTRIAERLPTDGRSFAKLGPLALIENAKLSIIRG